MPTAEARRRFPEAAEAVPPHATATGDHDIAPNLRRNLPMWGYHASQVLERAVRSTPMSLFIGVVLIAACSEQKPLDTQPVQSTPTNTWEQYSTTTTTTTTTVTTNPGAAAGAMLVGLDPTNAVSNCNLDPLMYGDEIELYGNLAYTWNFGGAIDQALIDAVGDSLDPINLFSGAQMDADLVTDTVEFVFYGFEVDANMGVLLDADGMGTNIPAAQALDVNGLSQGYHIAWYPWIFTYPPATTTLDPNYMEVGTLTLEMFLGVDANGNLTQVTIDGNAASSAFEINLGTPTWDGDPALTDQYCTITYFLDGRNLTAL